MPNAQASLRCVSVVTCECGNALNCSNIRFNWRGKLIKWSQKKQRSDNKCRSKKIVKMFIFSIHLSAWFLSLLLIINFASIDLNNYTTMMTFLRPRVILLLSKGKIRKSKMNNSICKKEDGSLNDSMKVYGNESFPACIVACLLEDTLQDHSYLLSNIFRLR